MSDANGMVQTVLSFDLLDLVLWNTSIIGRAVVLHAKPDDGTSQPSGAAGQRILMGVIGYSSNPPTYMATQDLTPFQIAPLTSYFAASVLRGSYEQPRALGYITFEQAGPGTDVTIKVQVTGLPDGVRRHA